VTPSITVQPVRKRHERKAFVNLAYRLYADDPHWVAPLVGDILEKLNPARHPFYTHGKAQAFLAREGDRIVGRVVALVNEQHNEFHGEKAAAFGLIEFERSEAVAQSLIAACARWARDEGMEILRGPFNLSINEDCGTLIEGFGVPPAVMMPYNPDWHAELLGAAGLKQAKTLLAYSIAEDSESFDRLRKLSSRLIERGGLSIRPFDIRRFDDEVACTRAIYNDAWEANWGFVPMTDEEFEWQARKLKPVLVPDMALFAEKEGESLPVAFSLSLPDYNQALISLRGRLFPFGIFKFLLNRRKINAVRVITLGVRKGFRGLGIDGLLIHKTVENGLARGYIHGELSWILEENDSVRRVLEKMGATVYKKYAIWEATVEELAL